LQVLLAFNVLFASCPILVYAVWEQDVSRGYVYKFPALYKDGQINYFVK